LPVVYPDSARGGPPFVGQMTGQNDEMMQVLQIENSRIAARAASMRVFDAGRSSRRRFDPRAAKLASELICAN